MIATVEFITIVILICLNIYQIRHNIDLRKSICVVTKYIVQEHDTFEPLLYRTGNQQVQRMITTINTLLLQKYRLSQKLRNLQEQYRTNIADISHDLKTPITILSGYIDFMALQYQQFGNNSPEVNLVIQKAQQKAQDVQHAILQQLDFARICSGDMRFPLKYTNLTELCREIALSYYDCLSENGFCADLNLDGPSIYADTSPDAIRCIMNNLIDNAIKYGSAGKFLGIAITQNDQNVIIQIMDHGNGIPITEQEKIFGRNYRIGDSNHSSKGRSGLGLSIVQNVAARCQLSIQLKSQHGSTCFYIIVRKS